MEQIKVAVVGCGRILSVYHDAFRRLEKEVRPVLMVDKDLSRAETAAARYKGCLASCRVALEEFGALLEQVKPDLLCVLLPHFLHGRYARAAMERGVHVLTEKPITISLAEADELVSVQRRTGAQLGVIFQNRYIPGVRRVRALVATGKLGEVKGAFSTLTWHRPPSYYACDWKGRWETEGGGVVIDQAIHSIDLVRYMTGMNAVKIMGHTARRVLTEIEVEDEADAAIWLENGAVYSFYACNYFTANSPIRVGISCEKGEALLTESTVEVIWRDGTREVIPPDIQMTQGGESYWGSCHYLQLAECCRALREGRAMPWTPEDAIETLRIVQGIYESARTQTVSFI